MLYSMSMVEMRSSVFCYCCTGSYNTESSLAGESL
nr:MAG TPA: hypothetical protein [Caudoviricetes sp.]